MAGRRKILKRNKNPLFLQTRDIRILKMVYDYRFLTGGQIKNLCSFNCQKRANDRLRKLFDNGFLSRRLLIDSFQKRILYFLGPKATEVISSNGNIDPTEVRRKRLKALKMRDSFLPYFLSLNDFRYSLEMATRNSPQIQVENWKYKPALFLDEEKKIYPDAYFLLKLPEKIYPFFLEIDCSTESQKRVRKKIEAYLDYGLMGDFEKQFGFKYYRLLVISKTLVRLKTLSGIIERSIDKSFCWLAVEKNIVPEKILTDIWLRPNKEGRFSLIK